MREYTRGPLALGKDSLQFGVGKEKRGDIEGEWGGS